MGAIIEIFVDTLTQIVGGLIFDAIGEAFTWLPRWAKVLVIVLVVVAVVLLCRAVTMPASTSVPPPTIAPVKPM